MTTAGAGRAPAPHGAAAHFESSKSGAERDVLEATSHFCKGGWGPSGGRNQWAARVTPVASRMPTAAPDSSAPVRFPQLAVSASAPSLSAGGSRSGVSRRAHRKAPSVHSTKSSKHRCTPPSYEGSEEIPPTPQLSRTLPPHVEYRWPMAASLENTLHAYGTDAAAYGTKHSFLSSSQEIGQFKKSAVFMNPFIDRFLERRPNGGVFYGRSAAAPKVQDASFVWAD